MLSRAGAVVATAALATLRLAVAGPLALPIHAGKQESQTGIFRVRVVCNAFAP
jgi:hypothetical protein